MEKIVNEAIAKFWQREGASIGLIGKAIIEEAVQSALAERTEQCARILQDRMDYLKGFDYKERITTTRGDASTIYNELNAALFQIRALNQPENKS